MSSEHYKVACKIPKSVLRCGPRRLLQHICEKCGSGKPFKVKSGKTITIPDGEWQITDRELMKVIGTDRRQTIYENRITMLKAVGDAVTVSYKHKERTEWPLIVYHVDLEKLKKLNNDFVVHSATENVDGTPNSTTESDTYTGLLRPGERTRNITPAQTAGSTPAPQNGEGSGVVLKTTGFNHQNPNPTTLAGKSSLTTSTDKQDEEDGEAWDDTCIVTTALSNLFPTWKIDVNDIWSLVINKKAPAQEIYDIIHWLPVSNNDPLKEAASSCQFRLWFREIRRQYQAYLQQVEDSDTHQHYESWSTLKLAQRQAASEEESLKAKLRVDPDEPVDPEDAAEEEAMWAADEMIDNGEAVDLDPMQDPFGDVPDEQFEDSVPECIDHPHYGPWSTLGGKLVDQLGGIRAKTGRVDFFNKVGGKPVHLHLDRWHDGQQVREQWLIRNVYNEVTR